MNDPRAADVAFRYVRILRELNEIGNAGFAAMLDTANAAEMTQLLNAAVFLQSQIDRIKALLRG